MLKNALPVPTRGPSEQPCSTGRPFPNLSLKRAQRPHAVVRSNSKDQKFIVEEVLTYDETADKLYSTRSTSDRGKGDSDGSIAALIPGGLPRDRPDQAGAETVISDIRANRPLKVSQDLRLYKARQNRIEAQRIGGVKRQALQKDAEAGFRRAIELDPTDIRGYVSLGTLYVRQNRLADARETFDEGCTVSEGKNPYVWTALANLERKVGNYRRAKQCYDAALVVKDTHAAAWHGWGLLEREHGNYKAARNILARGIQATQGNPSPYLYEAIGNLAGHLDLVDEARYWFRRGTNTPFGVRSHALYTSWAFLEWKKGDVSIVPYLFEMALKQHPKNRYALLTYAMFEKELGDLTRCRALLDRAIELNPSDPALFQASAMLYSQEGNTIMARHMFKKGTEMDSKHMQLWQAWAIMEWRVGNIEKARTLFQQAVWSNPKSKDSVYVWQAWGVMEGKLGNAPTARALFKAGLKAQPDNEQCWQAWSDMEESMGLFETADELRNYRSEARSRIELGRSFSTLPSSTNPVLRTITNWAKLFDRNAPIEGTPEPQREDAESMEQLRERNEAMQRIVASRGVQQRRGLAPAVPAAANESMQDDAGSRDLKDTSDRPAVASEIRTASASGTTARPRRKESGRKAERSHQELQDSEGPGQAAESNGQSQGTLDAISSQHDSSYFDANGNSVDAPQSSEAAVLRASVRDVQRDAER